MIKDIFRSLTAKKQQTVVLLGIGAIITAGSYIAYSNKGTHENKKIPVIKKNIPLDKNILERSAIAESKREISRQNEIIETLRQEIDILKDNQNNQEEQRQRSKNNDFTLPPIPPPPAVVTAEYRRPISGPPQGLVQESPQWYGDIVIVSNSDIVKADPDVVKKKDRAVYLPPSFMEAMLLSGLDAKTSAAGSSDPAPVLLRVMNMAILPNDIKSHLKGCFVIAHGFGHLDDERVALRLVSLSCITKKGHAVIDQQVKGFVVDSDGKIGLRGTVVAKMGSMLARSFLAGFFGGVGDAFKASSLTSSVSPLGVTKEIKPEDLAKAGVGGGLSQSAGALQQFYLDLARQTLPVIEVGATKNVTVVISEGVELKIKDYCLEDRECEQQLAKVSS